MAQFHQRFDIVIGIDEARRRFVNRVYNEIFKSLFAETTGLDSLYYPLIRVAANALGERIKGDRFENYTREDFYRVLRVLEACYAYLSLLKHPYEGFYKVLDDRISTLVETSEVDLGITWANGVFTKTGAKLLDDKLVNDSLRWLRDKQYASVLQPFEKSLTHLLEAEKHPEFLSDVVTDAYESLEGLAKIITGKDRDLSANQELFVKKLNVSEDYKRILKEYISYANNFRHAAEKGKQKPNPTFQEAESFVYLTGVFIRLALSLIPD